ncbi:MAG: caspase family protein [Alphaproteobacteria bacterium]|nr:caspase family protein [Alphaproteobacteria bacterium]
MNLRSLVVIAALLVAPGVASAQAPSFDGTWSGRSTRATGCAALRYDMSFSVRNGAIEGSVVGGIRKVPMQSHVTPTGTMASGTVLFAGPPAGTVSGKLSGDAGEITVEHKGCWIRFAVNRTEAAAPPREAKAPPADDAAKKAEEAQRQQAAQETERQRLRAEETARQKQLADAKAREEAQRQKQLADAKAKEEAARQKQLAEAKAKEDAERRTKADEAARQKAQRLAEAKARDEQERKARDEAARNAAPDDLTIELAFWDTIKSSTAPGDYQAYLRTYPKGKFVALAQMRVQQFGQVAAARPADAPPKPPAARPEMTIDFGKFHALVIGNNDYGGLPALRTAIGDAMAVGALLSDAYGFEVRLLQNATRGQILGALADLRGTLGENDNLLIYYAGHGYLDQAAEQGYWLPIDAERNNPGNWIANSDLTAQVRAMKARHVMVVADSCYSGTLVRGISVSIPPGDRRVDWLKRLSVKRARTVLASGGVEPVLDGGGGGHSVFAKAFMDALMENDSVLDGQSLFVKLRRPVVVNSSQVPEYADIRQAGHDGGDFLFVRRK